MTSAMEQPEAIKSMQAALAANAAAAAHARQNPKGPAIESKPVIGHEFNIKLALTPGMIALIAAPATILITMLVGWVLVKSAGFPVHAGEMLGGALVNTMGGIAASLPLFILMKRGTAVIAQAGILGIALRIGTVLMGLLLAGATPWGLDRMALVYWTMGFYGPLLIVETGVVAWLSHKAAH